MIKLTNIQKNNGFISCLVFVEDCEKGFEVMYDVENENFEDYSFPQGYEWCTSHMAHAKRFMKTIQNEIYYPHEKLIMWY